MLAVCLDAVVSGAVDVAIVEVCKEIRVDCFGHLNASLDNCCVLFRVLELDQSVLDPVAVGAVNPCVSGFVVSCSTRCCHRDLGRIVCEEATEQGFCCLWIAFHNLGDRYEQAVVKPSDCLHAVIPVDVVARSLGGYVEMCSATVVSLGMSLGEQRSSC